MSLFHPSKSSGWCGGRAKWAFAAAFLSTCILSEAAVGHSQTSSEAAKDRKPAESGGVIQSTDPRPQQTMPEPTKKAQAGNEPNGAEWLIAPIPISSPAIGTGLAWAAARVFPLNKEDRTTPPSIVGVGGVFTNNGSRAIAVGGKLYFSQDKYRLTAATGYARVNADVYGVGKPSGDQGLFLPLTGKGSGILGEFLFRLRKGIYLGPRAQYRNLSLSLNREKLDIPDINNPPERLKEVLDELKADLLQQRTVAIGPRFQLDTRDSTLYPRRGVFLDFGIDLFSTALGSEFTYQYYMIGFNKYVSAGRHQVIAFRGMGCAAAGDRVPVYDLCFFGSNNDVRGYPGGRYQDRRMFATQAEYRLTIPAKGFLGRFGVVAFGGFGGVATKFSEMRFSDLLPAGGGGIRFRLTKSNPINLRIDCGIGRVGHTLSMGIGEAF